MVKPKELKEKRKEKIMLKGETGTGKTHTALECAKTFIEEAGGYVFIIDTEDGVRAELKNWYEDGYISDETLSNIEIKDVAYWEDIVEINLKDKARKLEEKHGGLLKIVDLIFPPAKKYAREYARQKYKEQGYYKVGEKKMNIDSKEMFTLDWQQYQVPNQWEYEFGKEALVGSAGHVVATAKGFSSDSDAKKRKKERYEGWFDTIIDCYTDDSGNRREWWGIVEKNRGSERETREVKVKPPKVLKKRFERYGDNNE